MSLSSVLTDRGSKERAFVFGCSPRLAATVGRTAAESPPSLGFAGLVGAPLLVETPRAVDARTIGTAFDYRARFELGGFNPAVTVGRNGLMYLHAILSGETAFGLSRISEHERTWPARDAYASHKYEVLRQGFDEAVRLLHGSAEDMDRAAILMAWCEQVFRAGTKAMDRSLGDRLVDALDGEELTAGIDAPWLRYLGAIRSRACPQVDAWLTEIAEHGGPGSIEAFWSQMTLDGPGSERPYYFPNPGFLGSALVGGADGDWIIGDTLIDCKTDQAITTGSLREHLLQLIGYALLDLDDWYKIRKVAIWYPRFGLLPTWSLDVLLSGDSGDLLPGLRAEVRRTWGARQAVAVRGALDQRRLGVLLAQNVNTPFEMLAELVETTEDVLTLKHVANNRGTPIEVLRRLADHNDPRVREQVAKNPVIPLDLLIPLLEDSRINVRRGALTNPVLPIETLLALADDPKYRAAIAANPVLPAKVLLAMARESSPGEVDFRKAIAKNPSSTPDVLKALDYWDGDATLVLRRAEMTPELIAYIYGEKGEEAAWYLQDKLRGMWDWQAIGQRPRLHVLEERQEIDAPARMRLAGYLAAGFAPRELTETFGLPGARGSALASLARVEAVLSQAALAKSPITELRAFAAVHRDSAPDLLRVLSVDTEPLVRAAVALNPRTPGAALELLAAEGATAVQQEPMSDVRPFLALNPASSVRTEAVATLERIKGEAEAAGGQAVATVRAKRRGSEAPVKRAEREADDAERGIAEFDPSRETPQQEELRLAAEGAEARMATVYAALLAAEKRGAGRNEVRDARAEVAEARRAARAARAAWKKTTSLKEIKKEARRLRKRATELRSAYERDDTYLAPIIRRAADAVYRARGDEVGLAKSLLQHERLSHEGELFLLLVARSAVTAPEVLTAIAEAGVRSRRISLHAAMNGAIDFEGKGELVESTYGGWGGCGCSFGRFGSEPSTCDESLSLSVASYEGSSTEVLRRLAGRCEHEAVREAATRELSIRGEEEPTRSSVTELVLVPETELVWRAASDDLYQRAAVAGHPELTPDIMIRMASDTRAEVRASLAKNPNAPIEILDFLGGEKSVTVRRAVASHPRARPELLDQLALENDYEIHWRLALNIGTPAALLARLAADSSPEIAVSAMLNPSTPPLALEDVAAGDDRLLSGLAGLLVSSAKGITERPTGL
jgi:hypothetical protein